MQDSLPFNSLSKIPELRNKVLFTLFALLIYRFGTYLPLPGIDYEFVNNSVNTESRNILSMFNMLSGGALGRMSVFALNIVPYITASIIIHLLSFVFPYFERLRKEGRGSKETLSFYTKILALIFAFVQAFGVITGFQSPAYAEAITSNYYIKLLAVMTLVGGTMFLIWLADQITRYGITNGTSILIFAGIVAGMPGSFISLLDMGRVGKIGIILLLFLLVLIVGLIVLIVTVEKAQRRVPVHYPKKQMGNKLYGGEVSYIPIKINNAGVIPPIFASSLLMLPITILNIFARDSSSDISPMLNFFLVNLKQGELLYVLFYVTFTVFFSLFYTSIVFNPEETASNLKKSSCVILGRKPGKHTEEYFDYLLTRFAYVGAFYLSFICIVPEIIAAKYSIPFYFGGTSFLIIVGVVIDVTEKIQSYLFSSNYDMLFSSSKK